MGCEGVRFEVQMVFSAGEEGEDVFFELQADEFFGPRIAMSSRTRWVFGIPSVIDGLSEEVDPASVGSCKC